VGAGLYYAEVVGLTHAGYVWVQGMDPVAGNDLDFNGNGFPDQWYGGFAPEPAGWHNEGVSSDVNGDGAVTNIDALLVIHRLRSSGAGALSGPPPQAPLYVDVNDDGHLTAIDALLAVSRVRAISRGQLLTSALPFTETSFTAAETAFEHVPFAERRSRHEEALLAYLLEQELRMGEKSIRETAGAGGSFSLDLTLEIPRRGA
jgi:hypothetical protein